MEGSVVRQNVTYREEQVDHVLLHSASIRNDVEDLADTGTLTGENGLVDAEVRRRDGEQSAVGGDLVADGDGDYITRNELCCMYASPLSVAEDFRLVGGVLLESLCES